MDTRKWRISIVRNAKAGMIWGDLKRLFLNNQKAWETGGLRWVVGFSQWAPQRGRTVESGQWVPQLCGRRESNPHALRH